MRAYELVAGSNTLDGLRRCERPDPVPLPTQLLVRVKAAALNYRDLLIARGHRHSGPLDGVRGGRRPHCADWRADRLRHADESLRAGDAVRGSGRQQISTLTRLYRRGFR